MTHIEPIIYDVLPADCLRILTLLPGEESSDLHCVLHVANVQLSDPSRDTTRMPFEALSYTWGPTKFPQRIICNGLAIEITQNLYDALICLRETKTPRRLWVDAVCINQKDDDEKAKQIPLMKYIYQYATQVLIWLGLAEEFTGRGLDVIYRAADCLRRESGKRMPQPNTLDIVPERFNVAKNLARGFKPMEDLDEWQQVTNILCREWFSRCWVFQESASATKATVQIGPHRIEWDDLCVATNFFAYKSYGSKVKGFAEALTNVISLCCFSRIGLKGKFQASTPLIHLLIATRKFKSSQPLDKIFALLGLAEEEAEFPVDYKTSVRELYTHVSRFLLLQAPTKPEMVNLQVLSHVKHYPPTKKEEREYMVAEEQLPSWVVNWNDSIPETKPDRTQDETQPMFVISGLASSAKFYAGGTEYCTPVADPENPYEISVHGFVFTTIADNVNFLRISPLSRSRLWDLVLEIRSVRADLHTPYPNGDSIDEAFALTLTMADTIALSNISNAETYHAIDFQHFCLSLYEQTVRILTSQGRTDDVARLESEWSQGYQRLKVLVGEHIKSPRFSGALQAASLGRKLFCTADGYIGIGDITLEQGDFVCILLGAKVPFILRPVGGKYKLVGECYLHGIMLGEALEEGLQRRELFTLI